jgi:hypothetical protein
MLNDHFATDEELLAWLDEDLAIERMAEIEQYLRTTDTLQKRLLTLIQNRDQGTVTVGEIWRRYRLSCPTRHELGSFLLGAGDAGTLDYVRFHIETVGCRVCQANLSDLTQSQSTVPETIERRQRIFASSAGKLKRDKPAS